MAPLDPPLYPSAFARCILLEQVYECTIDRELLTEVLAGSWQTLLHMRRADAASALTVWQAALFCVDSRHGHHLESMTSNRKSESVSRRVFN